MTDIRNEILALQDAYITTLDFDRIEAWPDMFVEDCFYEIIPKENVDMGLPAPIIHCDSKGMLRDRVVSLRNANIFQPAIYRHFTSGYVIEAQDDGSWSSWCNYVVINTTQNGESSVYQAGRYHDIVVREQGVLRFKSKRCIYDTSRVQTLLAIPI